MLFYSMLNNTYIIKKILPITFCRFSNDSFALKKCRISKIEKMGTVIKFLRYIKYPNYPNVNLKNKDDFFRLNNLRQLFSPKVVDCLKL